MFSIFSLIYTQLSFEGKTFFIGEAVLNTGGFLPVHHFLYYKFVNLEIKNLLYYKKRLKPG